MFIKIMIYKIYYILFIYIYTYIERERERERDQNPFNSMIKVLGSIQ